MSENENPRIYAYVTKKTFINFEDATAIGKIRIFAGKYTKGQGAAEMLAHFVDVPSARPFLLDMQWGKPIDYKEYKGGSNGTVTSRVFAINTVEKGYYLELTSGPGRLTETGAIAPAGPAESSISIFMPFSEARMLAADLLEYLLAARAVTVLAAEMAKARNGRTAAPAPAVEAPAPAVQNPYEFEELFPRGTSPEADAQLHKFKYANGTEAPDNDTTRAIYTAFFMAHRKRPASGKSLSGWWKLNKPAEDAPAEA